MNNNLQPLIFFEHHLDPIVKKLINADLKELYHQGYRILLMELYKGYTVKKHIGLIESTLQVESSLFMKVIFEEAKSLLLNAPKCGFKVIPVDPQDPFEAAHLALTASNNEIQRSIQVRDQVMAQTVLNYALKYKGAIIGVFGFAHYALQGIIEQNIIAAEKYDFLKPIYLIARAEDSALQTALDIENEASREADDLNIDIQFLKLHEDNTYYPYGIKIISGSLSNIEGAITELNELIAANAGIRDEL